MSANSQQQSPPSRSSGQRSGPPVRPSQPLAQPTQASQSSDGSGQVAINAEVLRTYILNISRCNTIGELVRLIPVPVQPVSRDILDGVYQASQKLGGAEALHVSWQDKLRSSDFASVAQLNSLKAPVVQISKEATGPDDGGLSSMNLDAVLHDAKKNALLRMIHIKGQEVTNLRSFVQVRNISSRLRAAWDHVITQQATAMTAEHSALILHAEFLDRVSQVAASIGESSYQRSHLSRKKRALAKKEADIDMTDTIDPNGKRQLMTLVEEALKRKEQSQRDRARSGKGNGSSAISKKKKTQKGQKPKSKDGKRKPSGKQQKRR